jgi:hypothetical protein
MGLWFRVKITITIIIIVIMGDFSQPYSRPLEVLRRDRGLNLRPLDAQGKWGETTVHSSVQHSRGSELNIPGGDLF